LVIAMCAMSVAPLGAHAQSAPQRLVTFVARQCSSYSDIAANRARNNIQESLQDLGVDSAYTGGTPVSPAVEDRQNPRCAPLPGWTFKLGKGYGSRTDVGPWGALSRVTGVFAAPTIVTQPTVPLLDQNGSATSSTIAGAVTVALTPEQAQLASASSALWAQAGVPGDPVLDAQYPGAYGFGALRCSLDALNGDNVEWIAFPTGARHVFCYAYYVKPPPTSGTIVVQKRLDVPPGSAAQTFTYRGNISYTSNHTFSLTARPGQTASETFYRAGGQTWSFAEDPLPGYARTGLSCTSASGASRVTTDIGSGAASVALASGDTVVCTYVNGIAPPRAAGLTIAKRTIDGIGTFGFAVSGQEDHQASIATTQDGVAVAADPLALPPGRYAVAEDLPPATETGRWSLTEVVCNGTEVSPVSDPVRVDLAAGGGATCLFTNLFTPAGSITLRKRTEGGTGRFGFVIRPLTRAAQASYEQSATTTEPGVPVAATGDDTRSLPLGTYDIVETSPTGPGGTWTLESVVCDGVPVGAGQGRARVALTRANPRADCTFINRRSDQPEPPTPEKPTPGEPTPGEPTPGEPTPGSPTPGSPTPGSPTPGGPTPVAPVEGADDASRPAADLHITKSVSPRVVAPGQRIVYRIVVTNRGPDTARDLVGTEIGLTVRKGVRIRVTHGSCREVRPVRCHLDALAPGQRVVLTAVTTAPREPGRHPNTVGVVTSTNEPRLADNQARATVVVRRARTAPAVTG
jgi:hypothetical protein